MGSTTCGPKRGVIELELFRAWQPRAYDRAVEVFGSTFLNGARFFRLTTHSGNGMGIVPFGISGKPGTYRRMQNRRWLEYEPVDSRWRAFPDDGPASPPIPSTRGTITFASTSDQNSRSTQMFINYSHNMRHLDGSGPNCIPSDWERCRPQGYPPFGRVTRGVDVVDQLNYKLPDRGGGR